MFKDKLKELRENEGLSQQALADKLFVSRSAVAKWENGNGLPSDVNLEAVCKFFDVEEEWLLDRNELKETIKNVDVNQTNTSVAFFASVGFVLLFCLLVGGTYWLHRFAIVFTALYLAFKLFGGNKKISKIVYLTSWFISFSLSIVNWIITAIPEPSNFFRIFTEVYNTNGMNLALSQLSSVLNILMLLAINTLFLIFNKRDKKTIASSIYLSLWTVVDVLAILIPVVLIVLSSIKVMDRCFGNCYAVVTFFNIVEELGMFMIFPFAIYTATIVFSILDMLMNAKIINDKKIKVIKIIMLSLLTLSSIIMPITWFLASPLNSPF